MKPEPTYVDGVPMCNAKCPHAYLAQVPGDDYFCVYGTALRTCDDMPCEPAIRNLVAQVAEVKRLCQAHNNPGSNPGAHKLAGDVLRIFEESE